MDFFCDLSLVLLQASAVLPQVVVLMKPPKPGHLVSLSWCAAHYNLPRFIVNRQKIIILLTDSSNLDLLTVLQSHCYTRALVGWALKSTGSLFYWPPLFITPCSSTQLIDCDIDFLSVIVIYIISIKVIIYIIIVCLIFLSWINYNMVLCIIKKTDIVEIYNFTNSWFTSNFALCGPQKITLIPLL